MSISNYSELQTTIINYLHRGDLNAMVPDFIKLAEVGINRSLRLLAMEQRASLSTSITARYIDLPARFLSASTMRIGDQAITQVSTTDMDNAITDSVGQPEVFCVTDKLEFERVSDQVYDLSLRFFKGFDIASDSTNWLLTNCPDIYLYGALMQAAPYLKDDARIAVWAQMLDKSIREANDLDSRSRSNQVAVVDSGLSVVRSWL
jgi:hypothetical protein